VITKWGWIIVLFHIGFYNRVEAIDRVAKVIIDLFGLDKEDALWEARSMVSE